MESLLFSPLTNHASSKDSLFDSIMSASPAILPPNPNYNSKGSFDAWTIVAPRRRKSRRDVVGNQTKTLTLAPRAAFTSDPSSWIPSDQILDPARSETLLRKIQSTIERLEKSQFYKKFISCFNSNQILDRISQIRASTSGPNLIQLVAYGIGSFESYPAPRLQLALAKLLLSRLGTDVASAEIFDPILSATECHVAEELGFKVVLTNEHGRRKVTGETPTIFFMPHCEAELYNSLLETNWRPLDLNRMVVIGNSFSEYARYVSEAGKMGGSVKIERVARHVLEARKFVKEIGIELELKGEDLESGFFQAFHDTSWHFFQVDDGTDLGMVIG